MKKLIVFSLIALAALSQAQGGGAGGGGQRGQFRGGGNSMTGLLNRPDVQKELALTDDQKTKLQELRGAGGGGNRGGGGGGGVGGGGGGGNGGGTGNGGGGFGGGGVDPAQFAKLQAEREKATLAILNDTQVKRLKELYIQRVGNRSLTREDIQKELGLSDDQVAKVKDLFDKQRQANMELMQKVRDGSMTREDMRPIQQKNDKTLDEELGKVLTADQASKMKTMAGAPFKFDDGNGG